MTGDSPAPTLSRWALWFGGLAFFACYFGQTVLGVVQPTIERDLGLSDSEAQWVVNSFFLTLALFAAPGAGSATTTVIARCCWWRCRSSRSARSPPPSPRASSG